MLLLSGAKAPAAAAASVLSEESAIVQQQQALQARILNILGGSTTGKTGTTATAPAVANPYAAKGPAAAPPPPPVAAPQAKAATNINFDNPSVQQALNNLISTGGIKTVQSAPAVAQPAAQPAPGYDQNAAYYQQQQQYAAQYAAAGQQATNGAAAAAANYAAAVSGYQYPGY